MYKVLSWCYIKSSEVCLRSPGLQLAILLTRVFGLLCSEHCIWWFLFRTLCNGNVFTWNEQCKDALDGFDALYYARIVSLRSTGGSQEVMSPFFISCYLQVGHVKISQNCTTTLLEVYLFVSVISMCMDIRLPPFCTECFVSVNLKQYLTSHHSLWYLLSVRSRR